MKGRSNGKDIDFGDLDLDGDLDIPGFSDDGFDVTDNRKPSLHFKDSFRSTLKTKFTDRGLLKRLLGIAAPKGYSQAFNAYEGISRGMADLYRDNQSELGPYLQKTGRLLERNAPRVLRSMPRPLRDALTQRDNNNSGNTQDRGELEDNLEGINRLFNLELTDKKNQRVKDATAELAERKRFELQMQGTELIARGINRIVSYQDSILVQFHRKSLELGYRQYDASVRSLMESRAYYQETTALLKSINKNAGLPDFVKLTHEEAIKDSLRAKLADAMSGGIAGWAGNYWKDLRKKGGDALSGALAGASMMGGMSEGMGLSKSQTAGMMLGAGAAEWGASRLEPFVEAIIASIAPRLEKTPGIKRGGNWLREHLTAVPQKLNTWAKSTTEAEGLKGEFIDVIKSMLDQYDSGTKIRGKGIESLQDPAVFDQLVYKTWTETIPAYLSSMDKTLREINTGVPQEEMAYSHYTGGMVTRSTLNSQNVRIGIKQSQGDNVRREVDGLLRELHAEQLTPEAKRILRRRMLSDLQSGEAFDPKRYVKFDSWTQASESVAEELIEFFSDQFSLDMEGKFIGDEDKRSYKNDVVQLFDDVSKRIPNSRQRMAVLAQVLGRRTFRELGITKYDGVEGDTIDLDAFNKMILGEDLYDNDTFGKELGSVKTKLDLKNIRGSMAAMKLEQKEMIKQALEEQKEQEIQAELAGRRDSIDVSSMMTDPKAMQRAFSSAGGEGDEIATVDIGTHRRLDTVIKILAKDAGIPGFASGGRHKGGWRVVGEDGPELEHTGPSSIFNSKQFKSAESFAKAKIDMAKRKAKTYKRFARRKAGKMLSPEAMEDYSSRVNGLIASARNKYDEYSDYAGEMYNEYGSPLVERGRDFYDTHTTPEAMQGYRDSATEMATAIQNYVQDTVEKGKGRVGAAKDRYQKWSDDKFGEGRNMFSPMVEALHRQTALLAELVAVNEGGDTTAQAVMRRLFGSAGVGATNVVSGGIAAAKWYAGKTLDFYKWIGNGGIQGTKLFGRGVNALTTARNLGVCDVYVKDSTTPALKAAGIRQELYLDVNTNKPIKSLKDITGPVIDTRTQEQVLTEEDFAKGLYKANGESLMEYVGRKALGFASGAARLGAGYLFGSYALMWNVGKKVIGAAVDQFTQYDAYFPGEDEPRIRSRLLKKHYYRDEKGEPISSLKDIKGAVFDPDGNVVISMEDFDKHKSLYARNGSLLFTIGRGVASAGSFALGLAAKALAGYARFTINAYKWAGRTAMKGLRGIGGLFRGKRHQSGNVTLNDELSQTSLEVQLEQLKVQQSILEAMGGKTSFLDADGDGIKDNSWTDITRKRAAKLAAKEGKGEGDDDKAGSAIDRLTKRLDKHFSKLNDTVEDSGEGGGFIDGVMDLFGKGKGKKGLGGMGGKGGGIGRLLGGGALTKGALALGGIGILGAKEYTLDAISDRIAKSDNEWIARTSPLVKMFGLPANIPGAINETVSSFYNGIFNADYERTPMSAARMTQYGVNPNDSTRVGKIRQLEEVCRPGLVGLDTSKPALDPNKFDLGMVDSLFGIVPAGTASDDENMQAKRTRVYRWLFFRFKPVYLAHCRALLKFGNTSDLTRVDEYIKGAHLSEALEIISVPGLEKVYDRLSESPFEDALTEGGKSVADAFFFVKRAAKSTHAQAPSKNLKANGQLTDQAKAATTLSVAAGGETNLDKIAKDISKDVAKQAGGKSGLSSPHTNQTSESSSRRKSLNISTAVRYLAYGLKELMLDKAEQLYRVEELFWDKIQFDGTTSADLNGSAEDHYASLNSIFKAMSDEHKAVIRLWFQHRFRPVFLQYALGVRRNTNGSIRDGADKITGTAMKSILQAATEVTTNVEGLTREIWMIPFSPWEGYTLGNNGAIILPYLNSIKTPAPGPLTVEGLDKVNDKGVSRKEDYASYLTGLSTGSKIDAQGKQTNTAGILQRMQSTYSGGGRTLSQTGAGLLTQGAGSYGTNVGNKVPHPGGGSGGDINMLPDSLGDGAAANRALITAAAKMVGFDPDIAMTIAGVESSWRPGVGAGTSNAQGLFQFIPSTWKEMLGKYASRYGINPNASPLDAKANAIMGALYLKENYSAIKQSNPDAEITDLALYMAHFLGPGGAAKWLRQHPSTPSSQGVYEYKQFAANLPVFKENGRELTVGETNAKLAARIDAIRKKAGVGGSSITPPPSGSSKSMGIDMAASPVAPNPDDQVVMPNIQVPPLLAGPGNKPMIPAGATPPLVAPPVTAPVPPELPSGSSVAKSQQQAQQQAPALPGNMGTVMSAQLQRLESIDATLIAIKRLVEQRAAVSSQAQRPAPSFAETPRPTSSNKRALAE